MQIHFKTKEDAIAYLQQRIDRYKVTLADRNTEKEALVAALQQRKEERSRRSWFAKLLDCDGAFTYWNEEYAISDLSVRISKVKGWIADNERLVKRTLSADNAEGFSVEE